MGGRVKDQLEKIDRLAERKPQYKEALGVYRQLLETMNGVQGSLQGRVLKVNQAGGKEQENAPVFQSSELPIDLKASSDLLADFMEKLCRSERDDRQGLANAIEKLRKDREWGPGLFAAILKNDKKGFSAYAQEAGLDPAGLEFLCRVALGPEMESLRSSLSGMIKRDKWDQGFCPLCGSEPGMAYFSGSGKRHLHCRLCGTEWPFQRIGCPFCGSRDHEDLGYLEPEQEEGLRVYFCKKCLRYLKTIDKRVFEEDIPMELEHLVTLHLDILAAENGYQ